MVGVVGGGVGGSLSWHRTPAASVRSQSWTPQPSNLHNDLPNNNNKINAEIITCILPLSFCLPAVRDLLLRPVAVDVVHPDLGERISELERNQIP